MTAQPSALLDQLISDLDLDDYQDVSTAELTLLNPKTQAPTTSKIILAGKEHPLRKRLDIQKQRKMRAFVASTGKFFQNTDPLEEYEDQTEYLVQITLGWNIRQGGKAIDFTPDNARKVYTDPARQWLRTQVIEGLGKTDLFIASSAKP